MIGAIFGGYIGGYIPSLWGVDNFSGIGILFSGLGSIAGIVGIYKLYTEYI